MAKEYIRDNYLISFIANKTDIRIHCYDSINHRAYEKIQMQSEYAIYDTIGICYTSFIKKALDTGNYIVEHGRNLTLIFTMEPLKMTLILDDIRTECLDLSMLSLKSEIAKLREEIGALREIREKDRAELHDIIGIRDKEIAALLQYIRIGNYSVNQCKEELACLSYYNNVGSVRNYTGCEEKQKNQPYISGFYSGHGLLIAESDHHDPKIPFAVFATIVDCTDIILLHNVKILVFMGITILNIELLEKNHYDEIHFYNVINYGITETELIKLLSKFVTIKKLAIIGGNIKLTNYAFTKELPLLAEITIGADDSAIGISNSTVIIRE